MKTLNQITSVRICQTINPDFCLVSYFQQSYSSETFSSFLGIVFIDILLSYNLNFITNTAINMQRFFLLIPKPWFLKTLEEIFLHSWWVILFALLCYTWLEHEYKQQRVVFHELTQQLMELKTSQIEASKQHDRLLKQINSQSDPAWVELTLIKVLGLVPENQTKIYFSHK